MWKQLRSRVVIHGVFAVVLITLLSGCSDMPVGPDDLSGPVDVPQAVPKAQH